jgi:exodeoxyribonuclease VII large subunit
MSEQRQIFTLKQVAGSIKKTIEDRYHALYWVKAEMHKLNRFPSGHCFPELVQKEDGRIVAQMTGSIWAHNYDRINKQFMHVVREPLREGTTLLLQVKISFHESYGLSLQIMDIDPNYTLGELQRERQETLIRLQKENLLNLNQSVKFPLLPKRIALISADTSKGLSDFRKVIDTNPFGYVFDMFLFQAYLQGDAAVNSISEQLRKVEKIKHHFDVVVIVRGGGGEVGLSCYNNYELCKAIATFPLPILTGIGHSTNMTVAEMVAYRNAITPTELGEFLIQCFHNFAQPVTEASKALKNYSKVMLGQTQVALNSELKLFKNLTSQRIRETNQKLVQASVSIKSNVRFSLSRQQELLLNLRKSVRRDSLDIVEEKQKLLKGQSGDLERSFLYRLKTNRIELSRLQELVPKHGRQTLINAEKWVNQLENLVRLMNPAQVLKRGYSIATIEGKSISATNPVKKGDEVKIATYEYLIETEVKKVNKNIHEE